MVRALAHGLEGGGGEGWGGKEGGRRREGEEREKVERSRGENGFIGQRNSEEREGWWKVSKVDVLA